MRVGIGSIILSGAAMLLAGTMSLSAQSGPKSHEAPGRSQPQRGQQQASQAQAPQPTLPDAYRLNIMIRTAIVALNQANQTGNYTVLRDLGAIPFKITNDPSRLAEIFAGIRKRQLDLSPTLFFTPKLVQQPLIDPRGLLRLVGYFPTAPERVNFDLYYVFEMGHWRLFGIGVVMSPANPVVASDAAPGGANQPGATPAATNQANAAPAGGSQPNAAPAATTQADAAPADGNQPNAAPAVATQANAAPGTSPQANAAPAPAAPAKPAAGKAHEKPAKASTHAAAPKPQAAVENKTTNNTVRIDLAGPNAAPKPTPTPAPSQAEAAATAESEPKKEEGSGFFPW